MSILPSVIQATTGLAIFLLGLRVMSSGLTGTFGKRLRVLLAKLTTSPMLGLVTGALATAFVQSSSAVAVTMVALVNAKVINLYQAFGIILGANIGTTITAQIISFDLGGLGLPLMCCGLFLLPLGRKSRSVGLVLVGFGGAFFGLSYLREALSPLIHLPWVATSLAEMSDKVFLGIGVGTILTALIQSSSAVNGIVIALAQESAISLNAAIAISLGGNIGTVATTLISSVGLTREAKATAYADFIFNVLGVLLLVPFFGWFTKLVAFTSPNLAREVANAHTIFNVLTAVVAVPFIRPLTRLAAKWAGFSMKEG